MGSMMALPVVCGEAVRLPKEYIPLGLQKCIDCYTVYEHCTILTGVRIGAQVWISEAAGRV